jgi:hypothetical protein
MSSKGEFNLWTGRENKPSVSCTAVSCRMNCSQSVLVGIRSTLPPCQPVQKPPISDRIMNGIFSHAPSTGSFTFEAVQRRGSTGESLRGGSGREGGSPGFMRRGLGLEEEEKPITDLDDLSV